MNKKEKPIYKEMIIKTKLKIFNYVVGDIICSIRGEALTGAFIQCFCLIDYLSQIASLVKPNKDKKYFDCYNSNKLWAIRCALVHTCGIGSYSTLI